ncbi:MAG: acyl-CoA dehydrogenase family protein [Desulfobacterales bacterium]|nr:acyl-CoA dehydrogenase family protein [Desulfobacterales bacterium]
MDFSLNKSQKEIQKAAWEFAKGEFDKELILELSKTQEFPKNILKKAGELGFAGIHYPESVNGGGMGLLDNVLVAETFCKKDSTLGSALMFSGYASECLVRFGDKQIKEAFLPWVTEGKWISTGAFCEPGKGYDISKIETTAAKDDNHWVINGKKAFVPFGELAGFYVTLCSTGSDPGSLSMILIEADREGILAIDSGEKLGGRLMPFSEVSFNNVRVPLANLIGKEGSGLSQTQTFFAENRIQIAGMAAGTAQGALDRALDYAKQREQFGKKLAQFQVIRHKIADMASKIESARYLTYFAAWCFDNGKADKKIASMAKITATRAAMEVTDDAIQLLGGYGYMTEYEIEHFYRDAKQLEIFQGTPSAQRDIIADEVIGKLK